MIHFAMQIYEIKFFNATFLLKKSRKHLIFSVFAVYLLLFGRKKLILHPI